MRGFFRPVRVKLSAPQRVLGDVLYYSGRQVSVLRSERAVRGRSEDQGGEQGSAGEMKHVDPRSRTGWRRDG